jgi:hypothetical protein
MLRHGLVAIALAAVMTTARHASAQRAGSIDTIAPAAARVGELVTIRGRGFGAFNARVTVGGVPAVLVAANGSQVTFRVPAGVAPGVTQVAATNPGGQSGSIGFRMLEGILLPGSPDALALTAITNRPPTPANDGDIQPGVILTRLEIYFARDATVADVNAVLSRFDAGIVSMLAGSTGLSVAVPRQSDLAALQLLADTVRTMHGVQFAAPGQPKEPLNIFVGTDIPTARHLLPARLPAAWNANALLKECGSNRVPILIPDYYGPPPAAFQILFPNLGDLTKGSQTTVTHGYKVISTLADPGPPSPSAGANPFLDCLDLRTVQVAGLNAASVQDRLSLSFPNGKFIVSMSLGDIDFCKNQGSKVDCTPDLAAAITTPLARAYRALDWKLLTQPRWSDFLMVAAAGNSRDSNLSGGAIYPGVTLAANENEAGVAAQPDPFFTFAADPSQWTPAQFFLDQGFLPKTASDPEMATLRSDVIASGLDASVEDNALVVGATTNLTPPDQAATSSPGYNLLNEASFSNSAPDVKMVGVSVPDVCVGLPCPTINGTSFAAPQVAGVASYLWLLSPTLRAKPAQTTRQAILQNTVNGTSVSGIVDAYAAVLSLDAAQLPTPQSAPIRLALLDVNGDGAFDEQDLALFVQHYFTQNPDGTQTEVEPATADFSRYDLNGDGYTGGNGAERFDLDRVGSTQFGQTQYSTVHQSIENEDMTYVERMLTDVDILCYYAYSALYTGHTDARRDLMAQICGATVTVNGNSAIQLLSRTSSLNAAGVSCGGSSVEPFQQINFTQFGHFGDVAAAGNACDGSGFDGHLAFTITYTAAAVAQEDSTVSFDSASGVLTVSANGSTSLTLDESCNPSPGSCEFGVPAGVSASSGTAVTFQVSDRSVPFSLTGTASGSVGFLLQNHTAGTFTVLTLGQPGVLAPGTYSLFQSGGGTWILDQSVTSSYSFTFAVGP